MSYTTHITDKDPLDFNTLALVQSNPSPASLENISWTLVSVWPRHIYDPQDFSPMVCNVDQKTGIFSMMSHFSLTDPGSNSTNVVLRQPGGFQYNPRTNVWSNFTLSPDYLWADWSATFALFQWPGKSALYQANIGASNTVNIGTLTTDDNGNSQFVNVVSWSLDPNVYGLPNRLVYGDNVIYQFGSTIDNNRTGTLKYSLARIPISGDPDDFNISQTNGVDDDMGPGIGMVMEFQDGKNRSTGLNDAYGTYIPRLSGASIQPIDGSKGLFAFVVNTPDDYPMQTISLEKSDYGQTDSVEYNLNITAPYGFPVLPPPNHTAAIVGGTVGGVALLLVIGFFILARRRWPQWRRKLRTKIVKMMSVEDDDLDDKSGLQGGTKIEEPSIPSDVDVGGKILVTDDMELDDIMDVDKGYIQNVELGRHPRPAICTSLNEDDTPSQHSEEGDSENSQGGSITTNRKIALTVLRSNSGSFPSTDNSSQQARELIPPPPIAHRNSKTYAPSAPQLHYTHLDEAGTLVMISPAQSSSHLNTLIHQPVSSRSRRKSQEAGAEHETASGRSSSSMDAAPPYSQHPDLSHITTPSFPIPPTPSAPRSTQDEMSNPDRVNPLHVVVDGSTVSECNDAISISTCSGEELEEELERNGHNASAEPRS
ncbi:hypothetical protein BGZ80_002052 [Entomortierella chlamydospora]|uniref:Uncharacterized protein n=1 Tax=Entomortierella chlamydospora TaxID=101097 RepID=A0A9P6SXJ3_9FUNG|nr:hypothetical protein BGZ80_002052 [Entomortierella chlamydospora]